MKRSLGFLCLITIVSLAGACSSEKPASDNTAPKNGVVETNANVNKNMNANTAPSNVGVMTNDNGNKNTKGVAPIDANKNANSNANGNHNKP